LADRLLQLLGCVKHFGAIGISLCQHTRQRSEDLGSRIIGLIDSMAKSRDIRAMSIALSSIGVGLLPVIM